jgi:hypothetical protein
LDLAQFGGLAGHASNLPVNGRVVWIGDSAGSKGKLYISDDPCIDTPRATGMN